VLEDVDPTGTAETLDVGPAESPKRGASVKPEPTVQVGSRTLVNNPNVPGIPGGPGKNGSGDYSDVGRNDPCPCGSGKKFKKCHGANL
jgi:preprotein translocase subunit SecA